MASFCVYVQFYMHFSVFHLVKQSQYTLVLTLAQLQTDQQALWRSLARSPASYPACMMNNKEQAPLSTISNHLACRHFHQLPLASPLQNLTTYASYFITYLRLKLRVATVTVYENIFKITGFLNYQEPSYMYCITVGKYCCFEIAGNS